MRGVQLSSVLFWLAMLSILALFLLPFIANEPDLPVLLLALFSAMIGGFVLLIPSWPRKALFWSGSWLIWMLLAGLANVLGDISISQFVRGIVGFLFYFVFLAAATNLKPHQIRRLLVAILLLSALICGRTIVLFLEHMPPSTLLSPGLHRATFFDPFAALPFSVIGFVLSRFLVLNRLLALIFMGFFIYLALLSQSKSIILIALLALLWNDQSFSGFSLKGGIWKKLRIPLFAFGVLLIAIFYADRTLILSRFLLIGTEYDVTTLGRLQEIQNAWHAFLRSPILGQGLGYTFQHVSTLSATFGETDLRRYTHNSIMFFLATTGIPGLILYLGAMLSPHTSALRMSSRLTGMPLQHRRLISTLLLLSLVIFSAGLMTAGYKLIHINIILGLVHGAIWRLLQPRLPL